MAEQQPQGRSQGDTALDSSPSGDIVGLAYAAVFVAAVVAACVYTKTDPNLNIVSTESLSIFAPFYIVAQAIERLLEPLAARVKVTTAEKAAVREARGAHALLVLAAAGGGTAVTAQAVQTAAGQVEEAEAKLSRGQADRGILLWAVASALSLLVCGIVGLGLLAAIAKDEPSEFIRTADVLLTGLAIGAGTKPLHDLISRIEKAKDNADPATKPAGVA